MAKNEARKINLPAWHSPSVGRQASSIQYHSVSHFNNFIIFEVPVDYYRHRLPFSQWSLGRIFGREGLSENGTYETKCAWALKSELKRISFPGSPFKR